MPSAYSDQARLNMQSSFFIEALPCQLSLVTLADLQTFIFKAASRPHLRRKYVAFGKKRTDIRRSILPAFFDLHGFLDMFEFPNLQSLRLPERGFFSRFARAPASVAAV